MKISWDMEANEKYKERTEKVEEVEETEENERTVEERWLKSKEWI